MMQKSPLNKKLHRKQNELAIRKAELKKEADIKQAEADAAYEIQKEEQRKEQSKLQLMQTLLDRKKKSS